ncbi:MAG: hypothetical protein V3R87_13050 [Dehalococcoidia bacterium]
MPAVESLQVQYLVAFAIVKLGELMGYIAVAIDSFGIDLVNAGGDGGTMANLTTGIFGTNSGLIYWINDKVAYMAEFMPYTELSLGLGIVLQWFFNFS